MKLTLQLQLLPTEKQREALLQTMAAFNAAATYAAQVGFDAGVFSQPSIHKLCYYELRERFKLSAQMAVRAIGKAVEAFKRDRTKCPAFRLDGAITYDQRILGWKGVDKVSLWTLIGREVIPLVYGEYQRERFDRLKGQVDLVYRDGRFFLYATVDIPDGTPINPTDFLGVDLGIVNLATDSDGAVHSGGAVEKKRRIYAHRRRNLQRKGTRAAKRKLRAIARKQSRYQRDVNHNIAKAIVALAQRTSRGIALEDLKGIRQRVTARRRQRARLSNWSFAQLQGFLSYKARLKGIPVVFVDPKNTSRTCPTCGHIAKANRLSQDRFSCVSCGFAGAADHIAARNIRARAFVKTPMVAERASA